MGLTARRAMSAEVSQLLTTANETRDALSAAIDPAANDVVREQMVKTGRLFGVTEFVHSLHADTVKWTAAQFYREMQHRGIMVQHKGSWKLTPEIADIPLFLLAWHGFSISEAKREEKAADTFSGKAPKIKHRLQGYFTGLGFWVFRTMFVCKQDIGTVLRAQGLLAAAEEPRQLSLEFGGIPRAPEEKKSNKALLKYHEALRNVRGYEIMERMHKAGVFLAATPSGMPIRFCVEAHDVWFVAADIMAACGRFSRHYRDTFPVLVEKKMPALLRNSTETYLLVPSKSVYNMPPTLKGDRIRTVWKDEIVTTVAPLLCTFLLFRELRSTAEYVVKALGGAVDTPAKETDEQQPQRTG